MRQILKLPVLIIIFVAFKANALLITDTYQVNQQLFDNQGAGHVFDLTLAGYSPETDSITNIKLIYDFTEINPDEDTPEDETREFVIFSSWIFGWREVYPDIDTESVVFEMNWIRSDACQYSTVNDVGDEYCVLNLDTDGTMNAFVTAYTDNLWLNFIQVDIEVDRATDVPEPNPAVLLILGLLVMALIRKSGIQNKKPA